MKIYLEHIYNNGVILFKPILKEKTFKKKFKILCIQK